MAEKNSWKKHSFVLKIFHKAQIYSRPKKREITKTVIFYVPLKSAFPPALVAGLCTLLSLTASMPCNNASHTRPAAALSCKGLGPSPAPSSLSFTAALKTFVTQDPAVESLACA
jgi:hypothetical protein